MKRLLSILLALPALAVGDGEDHTSRFYFNHGAEQYVINEVEKAREWVEEGLALYPDDRPLLALKKLLEQPPQDGGGAGSEQKPEDQQAADSAQSDEPREIDEQAGEGQATEQKGQDAQPAAHMSKEEAQQVLDAMRDRELRDRARAAADRIRRETSVLSPVEKDW